MSISDRIKDPIGWLVRRVRDLGFERVFGRWPHVYRGIVVDNQDPENRLRLRIQIPSIGQTTSDKVPPDLWALPALNGLSGTMNGQSSGLFMPPNVGDVVWVMFENGRTDEQVYLGGWLPANNAKTSEMINPETPSSRVGIRTKSGHFLRFEDNSDSAGFTMAIGDGEGAQNGSMISVKKSENGDYDEIIVSNDSGCVVFMDNEQFKVFAPDGSNVQCGDDKIALINKSGSFFSMDGKNIDLSCSGNITMSCGKKITLKAPVDIGPGPVYEPAVTGRSYTLIYMGHTHITTLPTINTSNPVTPNPPIKGNGMSISVRVSK